MIRDQPGRHRFYPRLATERDPAHPAQFGVWLKHHGLVGSIVLILALILSGCAAWPVSSPADQYASEAKSLAAGSTFNVVSWEITAISDLAIARVQEPEVDYTSPLAKGLVLRYMQNAVSIGHLEAEIERLASGQPQAGDPPGGLESLQLEANTLRMEQAQLRPRAERIIEAQVADTIRREHAGWFGQAWPPPAFEFTEPPYYLVLSPRNVIELRLGLFLRPDLSLQARENLEQTMERVLPNTSALVTGTGGFSSWPAMIVDRASLSWVLSAVSHEWVHSYLVGYPLGWHYGDNSEVAAINETVADLVGDEIGQKTLERFYPEIAAQESASGQERAQASRPGVSNGFDFNTEMRLTRLRVDELLKQGEITAAEQYMEERRLVFVEHGFYIRRLNQAYFAFHGSYRTSSAAPPADPIAPRLQTLRRLSPSLASFLARVEMVSSLDQLEQLVPSP